MGLSLNTGHQAGEKTEIKYKQMVTKQIILLIPEPTHVTQVHDQHPQLMGRNVVRFKNYALK